MTDRVEVLESRLDAMNDALARSEDRIGELEQQVGKLTRLVDPDPGNVDYQQLTKPQRVNKVRTHLFTMAENAGQHVMKYRDVKQLFNGHPSDGYCYELMEQAAQIDGFAYETGGHGKGEKRLRVNPEAVNDEGVVHGVNNDATSTPA